MWPAALVGVASTADGDVLRVSAGDPDASLLFQVLSADVGSVRQMPPGFQLADEDVAALAVRDTASGFIVELHLSPGLVDSGRGHIATDGTIVWLVTYDDLLVRFDR